MSAASASIAIASESALLIRGFKALAGELASWKVVGSARSACRTQQLLRAARPEVLVIDLPLLNELERLADGQIELPKTLVLAYRADFSLIRSARYARTCAFALLKASETLLASLLQVLASCREARAGARRCQDCPARAAIQASWLPLSPRDLEILQRVGLGQSNREIARALELSVKTVETHKENIKRKLALPSGYALIEAAVRWRRGDFEVPQAGSEPQLALGRRRPASPSQTRSVPQSQS